jgi:hypothetical protein
MAFEEVNLPRVSSPLHLSYTVVILSTHYTRGL